MKLELMVASLWLSLLLASTVGAAPGKPAPAGTTQPAVRGAPVAAQKTPPPAPPVHKVEAVYAVTNALKVGGEGGWDSVTLDAPGKLLYVPRETRTQVIEAATGKVVAEIGPAAGARSVALVPEVERGFITNRDGTLTVFDLKTFAVLGVVAIAPDPDAILYDPRSKRLLICCPTPKLLVPVAPNLDLKTGKADPPIEFEGTPKGLVADEQGMVYVTLSDKDEIAVVDTRMMKVATTWALGPFHGPTGIAMDRRRSRLFVACGSRINILSATDGHDLGEVLARKTDSWRFPPPSTAFFDGKVFGTCGDGTLTVIGQTPEGKFEVQQTVPTEVGARPITIDPKSGKMYLPSMETERNKPVPGSFKIVVVEKK